MEILTTISTREQGFYKWVPVLFVLCMHVFAESGNEIHILATAFTLFHRLKVGGGNTQCGNVPSKAGKRRTASKQTWMRTIKTKRNLERNTFSMFLRPQGYTQNVLVRHRE